MMSYETTELNH